MSSRLELHQVAQVHLGRNSALADSDLCRLFAFSSHQRLEERFPVRRSPPDGVRVVARGARRRLDSLPSSKTRAEIRLLGVSRLAPRDGHLWRLVVGPGQLSRARDSHLRRTPHRQAVILNSTQSADHEIRETFPSCKHATLRSLESWA